MNAFCRYRFLFTSLWVSFLVACEICVADEHRDLNLSAEIQTRYTEEGPWDIQGTIIVKMWWRAPEEKVRGFLLYADGSRIQFATRDETHSGGIAFSGRFYTLSQWEAKVREYILSNHTFKLVAMLYTEPSIYDEFYYEPPPLVASKPSPPDGAIVTLSPEESLTLVWWAGIDTSKHDIYFGTDMNAVTDSDTSNITGTYRGRQIPGSYTLPERLDLNQMYYWRIDEVRYDGVTVCKGKVWSFRTKPYIPVTDPNLVCWWTFDEGHGAKVLDWSGHDHDGTRGGKPEWVDGYDGYAMQFIAEGDSVVHSLSGVSNWPAGTVALWVKADRVGQDALSGVFGSHVPSSAGFQVGVDGTDPGSYQLNPGGLIFGTVATDWTHIALSFDGNSVALYYNGGLAQKGTLNDTTFNQFAVGVDRDAVNSLLGMVDDFRVYDKALTQAEVKQLMRIDPLLAWDPSPANGSALYIEQATLLSWSPGDNAAQHDVYLGADIGPVTDANVSDTSGIYRGRQVGTNYATEQLDRGQTYYWRVDEAEPNDTTVHKGNVWRFTNTLLPIDCNACPLDAPVLHSEPNTPASLGSTIWWDAIADANSYYAQCAADANFLSVVADSGWINETACTFNDLDPCQTYWYRTRAKRVQTWSQTSQAEFQTSSLTNTTITSEGDVVLASMGRVGPEVWVIEDPSYEEATGWKLDKNDFGGISIRQSSDWQSSGSYSFYAFFNSWCEHSVGDYGRFRQTVDWTGAGTLVFDYCTVYGKQLRAKILIGQTEVWSAQPTGLLRDPHYNVEVNVSAFSGPQVIELRIETTTAGTYGGGIYFDNLRTYAPIEYVSPGSVISPPIALPCPAHYRWDTLDFSITTPSGTELTVAVLPASGPTPIPGYENLVGKTDLSGIRQSTIRLRANLSSSDPKVTPALHQWCIACSCDGQWSNAVCSDRSGP